jgi:flagellar hook-length control protein FliK
MEISMVTAPAAGSTTPTATASGNAQVLNGGGATLDVSNGGASFNQVLDGEIAQDTINQPAEAAMALAGLLQILPSLMLPIQNVVQNQAQGEDNQGLPEMLLQAMNSNDALADKLLQDPNVAQWFQQAQAILSALTGKDASPVTATSSLQITANVGHLQAQKTLLALSSILKEQPNNVVLGHIVQDLQKVIQPLLPQLATDMNQAAVNLNHAEQGAGLGADAVEKQASANGLIAQATPVKGTTVHAAIKHNTVKHSSNVEVDPNNLVVVQPIKSQLELLAAKNAVNAPLFIAPAHSEAEVELTPVLNVEPATGSTPIMQFTDMLKTPLQTETVVKAAPQTIYAANFAQEMTEHMLKTMKITLDGGISEAKLSLFPKNLGHVDVKITMHEGQLVALFAADTLAGKQMLESQLPQLRQTLQSQGLQVDKLEVTQNQNMQSSMFQDQRHGQQANSNSRQNKGKSSENYDLDNLDFVQELSATAQMENTSYGISFDVTA